MPGVQVREIFDREWRVKKSRVHGALLAVGNVHACTLAQLRTIVLVLVPAAAAASWPWDNIDTWLEAMGDGGTEREGSLLLVHLA